MAMFSDGGRPTHSAASSITSLNGVTAMGDMRTMLQTLLDDNEKQLSLASSLGQKFLAQRMELEERINQILSHGTELDPDTDDEARERLQGLADAVQLWQRENENLVQGFHGTATAAATASATVSLIYTL